jgi:hypothetical protein
MPPETHTPPRAIRISDDLWHKFTEAADRAGMERAGLVREFIRWYVGEEGATLPRPPAPQ